MSMTDTQDVERIRYRMQRIRHHMDDDVQGIVANAKQLLDWEYYVQRYPLGSIACVALAGFLLVPRPRRPKLERIYLDEDGVKELSRHGNQINVTTQQAEQSKSFWKSAAVMVASLAARSAVAYASQKLSSRFEQKHGE